MGGPSAAPLKSLATATIILAAVLSALPVVRPAYAGSAAASEPKQYSGPSRSLAMGPREQGLGDGALALGSLVDSQLRKSAAQGPPTYYCPGNLLKNAGFENGFTARGRTAEVVANEWTAWFAVLPGVEGINYAPRYLPRFRQRDEPYTVHTGLWSQEMGTEHSTHTGGLWQRLQVPRDSRIQASIWVQVWATDGEVARVSAPPGTYATMLGIDPRGGEDPYSDRIVWTAPITITDLWVPLNMEVDVAGPNITMFTRGQPLRALAHNVSRWDSACLRVVGLAGEPTYTLVPLPTATVPSTPSTPTATPNAETAEADMFRRRLLLAVEATDRAQDFEPPTPFGAGPEPMATLPTGPIALASPVLGALALDPAEIPVPEGSPGATSALSDGASDALRPVADNVGLLLVALGCVFAVAGWWWGRRRSFT